MSRFPAVAAVALLLASCATLDPSFEEGRVLIQAGEVEKGLKLVEKAVEAAPRNPQYRSYLYTQRAAFAMQRVAQADAALAAADFDGAAAEYKAALTLDPSNVRAAEGLSRVNVAREYAKVLEQARADLAMGRLAQAEAGARRILNADPRNLAAREVVARIVEAHAALQREAPIPGAELSRPASLEFRDTTLKAVFDALARSTGVNFVFDKDVRTDQRVTFFVKNTRLDDLIRMVLATNQLERKLLNDNSILIYPNTPQKRAEYQDLAVRSFYLGNADVKQTLNMLRTVLKTRDLFIDEKLNLLVMRDTPEAIRLAEKLIAAQDLPEPEVILELEVMEVARGRLVELGVQWPNTLTVLNIVPSPATTTTTGGVVVTTSNATTTTSQLTLDNLRHLRASAIGVSPNPAVTARAEDSDVNLLANPRIRIRNHEKAKVHIGDRVPVITTTSTANVGVSESVTYLDVGLRLEAEPTVYGDNDVAIKLSLEVSSIVREVKSAQGTLTYQLGTRNTATALRVKDGETQVLAGLISEEDRAGATKVPGLGDLPLIGHLFGVDRSNRTKTEIVLLVTPHVVRNVLTAQGFEAQFHAGTEQAVGAPRLAMAPGARASLASVAGGPLKPLAPPSRPVPQVQSAAAVPSLGATLAWSGATSVPLGGEVTLGLRVVDGPPDAGGVASISYDPAVLAVEGATQPGRASVQLAAGAAAFRARVVAKQPTTTQVRVESATLTAGTLPVETQTPGPQSVTIGAAP